MVKSDNSPTAARHGALWIAAVAAAGILLYLHTFAYFWKAWNQEVQYSLAFLVPFVSGYFFWKQGPAALRVKSVPTLWGLAMILVAVAMHIGGTVLDVSGPSGFSLLLFIIGCCFYFRGAAFVKVLWFPLAYLAFAVPVPGGVTDIVGFPLQLWASGATAAVLRLLGLAVTRNGVNLSVPGFEFQVAEACSGMSSLVALVGVTAIFAYTTKLPNKYKWLLFFMAIPVALIANVVRITTIALVGYEWGSESATGIYHTWSSPILFVVAIILLFTFSYILERISSRRGRPVPADDEPSADLEAAQPTVWPRSARPFAAVIAICLVFAAVGQLVASRAPKVSFNADLASFPKQVGSWEGYDLEVSKDVQKALNADEILSRQYIDTETKSGLGLLMVYRKYGRRDFVHRPELCYPAAGWEIVQKSYTTLPYNGKNIRARLIVAEKRGNREIITYWFASGDRTEGNFAKQQVWMALDRLQDQRYGWAFVRINMPVLYGDEETLKDMRAFLRKGDTDLVRTLTGRD